MTFSMRHSILCVVVLSVIQAVCYIMLHVFRLNAGQGKLTYTFSTNANVLSISAA
jgi:hypothetical protein